MTLRAAGVTPCRKASQGGEDVGMMNWKKGRSFWGLSSSQDWRNSTETRGLLDSGLFCCLHKAPAGKRIYIERQNFNPGPCAKSQRVASHRKRLCPKGTSRLPHRRHRASCQGLSLHVVPSVPSFAFPSQPQINPGMFIDLNTIVPTMARRHVKM